MGGALGRTAGAFGGAGGALEFLHGCSFCGWTRECDTPVMLSPSCDHCGCALDARALGAGDAVAATVALPPRLVLLLRGVAVLLGALALWAAASLGFHAAGAAGAMTAFGAGGFLMLPFVPERLGAPGRR
jgi:hypothetical protein